MGNPNVLRNDGLSLTQLLIDTVTKALEWKDEVLRERLSAACVDGQYIHCNMKSHLADILNLPKEFTDDSVIWDAAHRLELACEHAKEGYSVSGQMIGGTKWLRELDNVLQHIMKIFRFGHNHDDLRRIAKEFNQVFLEFHLFSDTRFVEYSHRTYDHFTRMRSILCEKLKRDENNGTTEKDNQDVENLQNLLVQLELVLDLLFMAEVSHLFTFCSKAFQRFDVVSFRSMNVYFKLKLQLSSARDSFNSLKVPDAIHLEKTEHHKAYVVWKTFENSVKTIKESQSFENIRLLLQSERGRVTRSGSSFGCDKEGFESIIIHKFKGYRIYLDLLISELQNRFEPWPEWVILCEKCLNFENDLEFKERNEAFINLLEVPSGINPLVNDEKARLIAEYATLHRNAVSVLSELKEDDPLKLESLWYVLLTEENYFKNCKFVNHFCLHFLNRSFNECIVESEVSSVGEIQASSRPLKDENAEKLNFVASNGPHPLVSQKLVDDMLSRHFGKNSLHWNFTTVQSKWYVSKTVDRHFQSARSMPNSLQ